MINSIVIIVLTISIAIISYTLYFKKSGFESPYFNKWRKNRIFGNYLCNIVFSKTKNGKINALLTTTDYLYPFNIMDKHVREALPGEILFEHDLICNNIEELKETVNDLINNKTPKVYEINNEEIDEVNNTNRVIINIMRNCIMVTHIYDTEIDTKYANLDRLIEIIDSCESLIEYKDKEESDVGFKTKTEDNTNV